MSENYIVATGHRPLRLGLDFGSGSNRLLTQFAVSQLKSRADQLSVVVSGMSQGWDQAVAHAALLLKIPLVCVLPFRDHGSNWPESARARHDAILERAREVTYAHEGPYDNRPELYIRRDHKTVDFARLNSGWVMALWDGRHEGGTWKTVRYALDRDVRVVSVWDEWQARCIP